MNGQAYFELLDLVSVGGLRHEVIFDTGAWTNCPAKILPPCRMPVSGTDRPSGVSFTWQGAGSMQGLLLTAASRAFADMGVYFLHKLASKLQLRPAGGNRPATELPLVMALISHIHPDMPAGDVEQLARTRGGLKDKSIDSLLLHEDNLQLLERSLDADDYDEMVRHKAEFSKQQAKLKAADSQARSVGRRSGGGATSSSTSRPFTPSAIPHCHKFTVAQAKEYLPPCASASKDAIRHFRWVVSYPRDSPPFSTSKAWRTAGLSEREALMQCLRVVWGWHEAAGGDCCPWVLE